MIDALEKDRVQLKEQIKILTEKITLHLKEEFAAKNGCQTCRGRGWIVVWDTMDSMTGCYAEYGTCTNPECTEESRKKSGLHPSYSKYDQIQGVTNPIKNSKEYQMIIKPLNRLLFSLHDKINNLQHERNHKLSIRGTELIVIKGRKVPIGTIGRVEYYNSGDDGPYVKIQTTEGEQYSVSVDNIDVLFTE